MAFLTAGRAKSRGVFKCHSRSEEEEKNSLERAPVIFTLLPDAYHLSNATCHLCPMDRRAADANYENPPQSLHYFLFCNFCNILFFFLFDCNIFCLLFQCFFRRLTSEILVSNIGCKYYCLNTLVLHWPLSLSSVVGCFLNLKMLKLIFKSHLLYISCESD